MKRVVFIMFFVFLILIFSSFAQEDLTGSCSPTGAEREGPKIDECPTKQHCDETHTWQPPEPYCGADEVISFVGGKCECKKMENCASEPYSLHTIHYDSSGKPLCLDLVKNIPESRKKFCCERYYVQGFHNEYSKCKWEESNSGEERCIAEEQLCIPPKAQPGVDVGGTTLDIDYEYLKKMSNNFINIEEYKEKNNFGTIATAKDKLVCDGSVIYTHKPKKPNKIYVEICKRNKEKNKDGTEVEFSCDRGLLRKGEINYDENTGVANVFYKFFGSEGFQYKCSFFPEEFECPGKKGKFSDNVVVAEYVYYFVPIGGNSYGNIGEQYGYYTEKSMVNDRIDLTGKMIKLRPLSKFSLFKQCCYDKLEKKYFWTFEAFCELPNLLKKVDEEKCKYAEDRRIKNSGRYLAELIRIVPSKLGGFFIYGSVITIILPSSAVGPLCYSEDEPNEGACSITGVVNSFTNEFVIISVDNPSYSPLAHEFGHAIGNLIDEYSLSEWVRQGSHFGRKNPLSEARVMDFPECCIPSMEEKKEEEISCGTPELCFGMPYEDEEGNIPRDKNYAKANKKTYSMMGFRVYQWYAVYPKNAPCPLRDCPEVA